MTPLSELEEELRRFDKEIELQVQTISDKLSVKFKIEDLDQDAEKLKTLIQLRKATAALIAEHTNIGATPANSPST